MIYELDLRLRVERAKRKISQKELGEIVGVDKSTVSAYEKGTATPSAEVLVRLSQYYNVSTDYLLGVKSERAVNLEELNEQQIVAVETVIDAFRNTNKQVNNEK